MMILVQLRRIRENGDEKRLVYEWVLTLSALRGIPSKSGTTRIYPASRQDELSRSPTQSNSGCCVYLAIPAVFFSTGPSRERGYTLTGKNATISMY